MSEAYIVSALRTPIGKFQGGLSGMRAPDLGALTIAENLKRTAIDPALVEEVIMGCVLAAGLGQNPARQAQRKGGVPDHAGAMTINKVCGSGLKAVALAAQAIKAGDADCIIAGGMENMSQTPYLLPEVRAGVRLGHGKMLDSMINDGLWDIYNDFHMGITAEKVAEKYAISRAAQDEYAYTSHKKACEAMSDGRFKAEIVGVTIAGPKGSTVVDKDESPRADTSVEKLATLKPAFKKDGSVTAGNAPSVNDGAASLIVVSERFLNQHKLKPIAKVTGYATGGMAPEWVMMAPVDAVAKLLKKTGQKISDFDLIEYNEAFAVAAIAVCRETGADPAKVNVNGGAVALGHPIGASGARILTTLLHALLARGKKKGLAALCLGGGNAVALSVEVCG